MFEMLREDVVSKAGDVLYYESVALGRPAYHVAVLRVLCQEGLTSMMR